MMPIWRLRFSIWRQYDSVEAENYWSVAWDLTETSRGNFDPKELQAARETEVERL